MGVRTPIVFTLYKCIQVFLISRVSSFTEFLIIFFILSSISNLKYSETSDAHLWTAELFMVPYFSMHCVYLSEFSFENAGVKIKWGNAKKVKKIVTLLFYENI